MGGFGDTKYSQMTRKDGDSYPGVPVSASFGRLLKGVSALGILVLVFTLTTWTFTGSSTVAKDEEDQSWSLTSFRETSIIIDTGGHYREQKPNTAGEKQNNSVSLPSNGPMQPSDAISPKENIIQGTGPESGYTRPVAMDKREDNSGGHQENGEIQTIFSTLHSSFADIKLGENNEIPTKQFVTVSRDIKPLLDAIGSSVSLIEGDMKGNADKLIQVYEENPTHCQTIQDMLTFDIQMGKANDGERSVMSLMWYKRTFEFIERFMRYTTDGGEPSTAAKTAYDEVLSKHHGMFVRATFRLGMNLLPSRRNLLRRLVIHEEDLKKPNWELKVMADSKHYFSNMEQLLKILRDFYTEHQLEN